MRKKKAIDINPLRTVKIRLVSFHLKNLKDSLDLIFTLPHPIQDPKMFMKRIPKFTLKLIIEARTPFCPVPANSVM